MAHSAASGSAEREINIFNVCEQGRLDLIMDHLNRGGMVDASDREGNTLLMYACRGGHLNIVEYLVSKKARLYPRLNSNDLLTAACRGGHLNIVEYLLRRGVSVHARDRNDHTPLMVACRSGHLNIVEYLLRCGVSVHARDINGATPLKFACRSGHLNIVEHLLRYRADVNERDRNGDTPLMVACQSGHLEIVEYLLRCGANVNERDNIGYTPLMSALGNGHLEIIKYLLKCGADVNTRADLSQKLLELACKRDDLEVAKHVVSKVSGVNSIMVLHDLLITACKEGHLKIVKHLLECGANVNARDNNYDTPLIIAVRSGHLEIIKHLLECGADVKATDRSSLTPLMIACQSSHQGVPVVKCLVEHGANVNVRNYYNSPLNLACEKGHLEIVEYLLTLNIDVNAKNGDGKTPLMFALANHRLEIIKCLLKCGAEFSKELSQKLLEFACYRGDLEVFKHVVSKGADVNAPDFPYNTTLEIACDRGYLDIVKYLVTECEVDVNPRKSNEFLYGATPLMYACRSGHMEIIQYLLSCGADVNAQNREGQTALTVVNMHKKSEVISWLFAVGDAALPNLTSLPEKRPAVGLTYPIHQSVRREPLDLNKVVDKRLPSRRPPQYPSSVLLSEPTRGILNEGVSGRNPVEVPAVPPAVAQASHPEAETAVEAPAVAQASHTEAETAPSVPVTDGSLNGDVSGRNPVEVPAVPSAVAQASHTEAETAVEAPPVAPAVAQASHPEAETAPDVPVNSDKHPKNSSNMNRFIIDLKQYEQSRLTGPQYATVMTSIFGLGYSHDDKCAAVDALIQCLEAAPGNQCQLTSAHLGALKNGRLRDFVAYWESELGIDISSFLQPSYTAGAAGMAAGGPDLA